MKVLNTNLVLNPNYYLIWFCTTLVASTYTWYKSHNVETFTSWQELQVISVKQFCPKMGQQMP
jgi:hypothetical protein